MLSEKKMIDVIRVNLTTVKTVNCELAEVQAGKGILVTLPTRANLWLPYDEQKKKYSARIGYGLNEYHYFVNTAVLAGEDY